MKFEDLKLPQLDLAFDRFEDRDRVASAVYDQMREHYEAKLAKPEPEELFEHPDMPGKKFRRLKVGEVIRTGDWWTRNEYDTAWKPTRNDGDTVGFNIYYREVPQPAPEWRLPDPPPGQQWHRDDWTQDMLVDAEGNQYRPLLLGENMEFGDERLMEGAWEAKAHGCGWVFENADEYHLPGRTRRPLPEPVEYVPLEPGDVPPGSAVRHTSLPQLWAIVASVAPDALETKHGFVYWYDLAEHYEILRPNSTTWEPCKKLKM